MLIFGYIVQRTNTKTLEPFFAISILDPNDDVTNDVISGFASCRTAMRIAPPAVNRRSVAASLWSPYVIGQTIYIFILFLSFFFLFFLA